MSDTRILEIQSPLGKDVLLIDRFEGVEAISDLFRFRVELRSKDKAIDPDAIIGKGVTVGLKLFRKEEGPQDVRYFHCVVERFGRTDEDDDYGHYRAELVPWLALLARRADCRIFQAQTVPQILGHVFDFLVSKPGKDDGLL